MKNLQRLIGAWGAATFGSGNRKRGLLNHLRKEIEEYERSDSAYELADMAILILDLAYNQSIHLEQLIIDKMAINFGRTWQSPDADGVCEHVRGEDDER